MALFRIQYASRCTGRYMNLNVVLPEEDSMMIDSSLGLPKPKAFKTLYLLHGYSGNEEDWLQGSRIREIAEFYRLAVVFPSGENSFYVDGSSSINRYGEMIGKEIVEFTRRVFPLSDKREDTFIGGLSMGGFGALRLGSFYSDTFAKILCFSGAYILDNIAGVGEDYQDDIGDYYLYRHIFGDLNQVKDSEKDPFWCAGEAVKKGNMPAVYMACGSEDFLIDKNRQARDKLTDLGVDLFYRERKGVHNWDFWSTELEPAIQWLLGVYDRHYSDAAIF